MTVWITIYSDWNKLQHWADCIFTQSYVHCWWKQRQKHWNDQKISQLHVKLEPKIIIFLIRLLAFALHSARWRSWHQQLLCEFKHYCRPFRFVLYLHRPDFYSLTHQTQTALWAEKKNDCLWIQIISLCARLYIFLSLHFSVYAWMLYMCICISKPCWLLSFFGDKLWKEKSEPKTSSLGQSNGRECTLDL